MKAFSTDGCMQQQDDSVAFSSPTTATSAACTSTLLVPRFLPNRYYSNNNGGTSTPDVASLLPSTMSTPVVPTGSAGGRQLLTSVTLLGVLYANCIGSGYGFEDSVGAAGPLVTLLFSLIIPWIWCLPTGLAVSELATAVRSNSGVLMWVNVAFHPAVSFMCVMITVFITFVGNASYPTLAAEYIDKIIPIGAIGKAIVKLICIVFCAGLNVSGVELVGNAAVLISFATLAPFLIFTIQQLVLSPSPASAARIDVQALLYVPPNIDWATFFAITSWSFANIENAGTIVEEVRNPKKTLAGAMVPLMLLTYPAYFLPVAAGVSSLGGRQDYSLWRSGYWATVAEHISGPFAKWMMLLGSITTSFGFTLTTLCCTSRNLEGMGAMDIFPASVNRLLTKRHSTYQTPAYAIVLNATVTSLFCLTLEFESIVALCQVMYCVRLLLIYAAVVQLRIRHPTLPRPYALPCGVFGCILALAPPALFSLVVAVSCAYHDNFVKGAVGVFLIGGFAFSCLYVAFHRPRGFRGQIVPVQRRYGGGSDVETSENDVQDQVPSACAATVWPTAPTVASPVAEPQQVTPFNGVPSTPSSSSNSNNVVEGANNNGTDSNNQQPQHPPATAAAGWNDELRLRRR